MRRVRLQPCKCCLLSQDGEADEQLNLNNTIMLVNSIKVYQQSDSGGTIREAGAISNQTGVGAGIPGDNINSTRNQSPSLRSTFLSWWLVALTLGVALSMDVGL